MAFPTKDCVLDHYILKIWMNLDIKNMSILKILDFVKI